LIADADDTVETMRAVPIIAWSMEEEQERDFDYDDPDCEGEPTGETFILLVPIAVGGRREAWEAILLPDGSVTAGWNFYPDRASYLAQLKADRQRVSLHNAMSASERGN